MLRHKKQHNNLLEMFNDTNMPLQELLTNIQSKVDDLDDVAKQIVGGVVGGKEKVNGAIKELTVEGFSLYGINFIKWEYDYDTFHIIDTKNTILTYQIYQTLQIY